MATIHDLPIENFLELSPDAQTELIRSIRAARRIPIKKETKKASNSGTRKRSRTLTGDLSLLSQEQLRKLAELLEQC